MSDFLADLLHEFCRYKSLADRAMIQLSDQEFLQRPATHVNPAGARVTAGARSGRAFSAPRRRSGPCGYR